MTWGPREPPLTPTGAVAFGAARKALIRRLLSLPDDRLATLSGVATPDAIGLVGPARALPWVDGILYVGHDASNPALWMPTTQRPSVPVALLQQAVLARCPDGSAPIVLVGLRGLPLGGAQPLLRSRLEALGP